MTFPIGKVESKTPENLPFPLDYVNPQKCLGPPLVLAGGPFPTELTEFQQCI